MALERSALQEGQPLRIGLVLAGGGARGAYQAGVVQYLARANANVKAIAGASIGALNGAVVGCAESLEAGAGRLVELWREVADAAADPAGAASAGVPALDLDQEVTASDLVRLGELAMRMVGPTFARGFLESLATEFVDAARLRRDLPVWVSVFPSVQPAVGGRPVSLVLDLVRSRLAAEVQWLCLNDLPAGEVPQALLASAALPLVLPPRGVGGRHYRDGGLADNTPAGALARHADLDLVIVVHLGQGALWDAHDVDVPIAEVRPSVPLSGPGLGRWGSLLALSPDRVEALRRQGLHDAASCLQPADRLLSSARGLRRSQELMLDALAELERPPEPG